MQDTIARYLSGVTSKKDRDNLRPILDAIGDRYASQPLVSAALEVSGTATLAQVGASATYYGIAGGQLVTIAAGTDMPALTDLDITAAYFNVFCFFIDAASVVTVLMGTEAEDIGNVKFPEFPEKKALVGILLVTYANAFEGGSTALSTATTVYLSPVGAFDPGIIL